MTLLATIGRDGGYELSDGGNENSSGLNGFRVFGSGAGTKPATGIGCVMMSDKL